MKDNDDLKELEDKIKKLETGKLAGEEAATLIDECVRKATALGG